LRSPTAQKGYFLPRTGGAAATRYAPLRPRTGGRAQRVKVRTVATHAFALHRAPAMFLQMAAEFTTIGSMLSPSRPIPRVAEDKLASLRRLDKSRAWNSLDDQLYCTVCKNVISGHQIEVVGGTNGLRALHLKCSTPGCLSTPADWLLPVKSDTCEIDIRFGRRTSVRPDLPAFPRPNVARARTAHENLAERLKF